MKKLSLIFLLLTGLFWFGKAKAEVAWLDLFNETPTTSAGYFYIYPDGVGTSSCAGLYDSCHPEATTTQSYSPNTSLGYKLRSNWYLLNNKFSGSTKGTISVWFRRSGVNSYIQFFLVDITLSHNIASIRFENNTNCNYGTYTYDDTNITGDITGGTCDTWNNVRIDYDLIESKTINYYVGGVLKQTIDTNNLYQQVGALEIAGIYTAEPFETDFFDDLYWESNSSSTTILPPGDTTGWYPTVPIDCDFTVISTTTEGLVFDVSGQFQNAAQNEDNTNNTCTYDDLNITFYEENCSNTTATSTHIEGSVEPNSSLGYSGTTSLPAGNYRIEYVAEGFDTSGNYCQNTHYCARTGIGYEEPVGSIDFWCTKYDLCAGIYDQCIASSTNFLDRTVCNIENIGLQLVCPNPAVLKKAWSIIEDVKNRWPLSYLHAAQSAFASVYTNVGSSTATNTEFSADLSQMDWASGTPLKTIRTYVSYFIILSFLMWLIWYSATEFFT